VPSHKCGLSARLAGIGVNVRFGGPGFRLSPWWKWGMWWRGWLRHCATNRKVTGLIPNGVMEFFIDIILPVTLWPWA